MTTVKIGSLLRITGQVVRTHPVHPELVHGTFICLDCRTVVKDVEQQFKYTQVRNMYQITNADETNIAYIIHKYIFVKVKSTRLMICKSLKLKLLKIYIKFEGK